MQMHSEWSQGAYETSLSSRCWWWTSYDGGWCHSGLPTDDEVRQIVAMGQALGPLPEWAQQMAEVAIRFVPGCGHYLFPRGYLQVVAAIGAEDSRAQLHSYCFAVESGRKRDFQDYCLCLDGWLAGADPQAIARELIALGHRRIDWRTVCGGLWQVLGEHTEMKDLLVERTLHQQRWWIKSCVWPGDSAEFGRDQYLGDYAETGWPGTGEGNPELAASTFQQDMSPRVQRVDSRLAEICPDWHWFRTVIVEWSWPCAPKAFRYLEKLLWCISRGRPVISLPSFPLENPEGVPGFLRCEDTWPDQDLSSAWWESFLCALRAWWLGRPQRGEVADDINRHLGEPTAIKRWLVRLLVRRLEVAAAQREGLGLLVHPLPDARPGTGQLYFPR